ncbi:hypothetical protein, partial [Klebsiella variicola]|uniref:hypothetical protein n=1 Tax=Klebsiella variicola TaxID=244366 RepID=UPI00396C69BA
KAKSSVERLGFLFLRFKKNPVPKGAGFFAVWGISPRWRCAYRGYKPGLTGSPDKVRSTASGETSSPTAGLVNISNTYHINRLPCNCPY